MIYHNLLNFTKKFRKFKRLNVETFDMIAVISVTIDINEFIMDWMIMNLYFKYLWISVHLTNRNDLIAFCIYANLMMAYQWYVQTKMKTKRYDRCRFLIHTSNTLLFQWLNLIEIYRNELKPNVLFLFFFNLFRNLFRINHPMNEFNEIQHRKKRWKNTTN